MFLSHTGDLREVPKERSFVAAAEAAVIRAGHAVTDMAYFTARDNAPADYCEAMVADADIYVGIVGFRYGTPVRGRAELSYTELEYQAAARLGLPRLIFMARDGNPALPLVGQPAEHAARQQAFRRRLLDADVTVAWIGTPSDLEIGLLHALMERRSSAPAPKYANNLRRLRGLRHTQQEMANRLGVSLSTYRSWEDGEHRPRPVYIRALCEMLDAQEAELGFGPAPDTEARPAPVSGTPDHLHRLGPIVELPAPIQASQDAWRQVRRYLSANAFTLTRMAADLYPRAMRVASTPLLTREDWLSVDPVDLSKVQLDWLDGPQRKVVKGTEAEARLLFPLRAPGHQFDTYTAAVRHVDKPALFENRPTYRLLDAAMTTNGAHLRFSLATYFEMIDISQAVAHEFAATQQSTGNRLTVENLPFRSLVGDPFDLRRRPVQAGIDALTLRWDRRAGTASFLLHWRDPLKVAVGGGMYSVMPVGVFQPSTVDPWGQQVDFDLWRNMVREFSEEFLGMPEHDGSAGARIDYDMWPLYRDLTRARESDELHVHCFGMGVDPLGLGIDILTAVVIDSEVFDEVFGERVQVNDEGHVVVDETPSTTVGFPFTEESVHRFLRAEQMGPGGAACLALAWRHRDVLFKGLT